MHPAAPDVTSALPQQTQVALVGETRSHCHRLRKSLRPNGSNKPDHRQPQPPYRGISLPLLFHDSPLRLGGDARLVVPDPPPPAPASILKHFLHSTSTADHPWQQHRYSSVMAQNKSSESAPVPTAASLKNERELVSPFGKTPQPRRHMLADTLKVGSVVGGRTPGPEAVIGQNANQTCSLTWFHVGFGLSSHPSVLALQLGISTADMFSKGQLSMVECS